MSSPKFLYTHNTREPLILAPKDGPSGCKPTRCVPGTIESTFFAQPAQSGESLNYVCYEHDEKKWEEAAQFVREGDANEKFSNHPTGKWSKLAYKILHHPVFYVFDLLLCLMLMLLALIERPAVFADGPDDNMTVVMIHGALECTILLLFLLILILRLIWRTPYHFFRHRRSVFITVMLCVMYSEAVAVLINQQSHLRITRTLRPVFFLNTYLMSGVRRVLRQFLQGLKAIVDIILLLLFFIVLFSLIAYYLFSMTDPNYFETFDLSYVSMFITFTTANNPDVMMVAYSQKDASPLFFILYIIITVYFVENILFAVVYTNFSKEEKIKFRQLFLHKREALHHAFHILTGPNGIESNDFLLFMQQYKPHIPEWQVMCVFKALHTDPEHAHKAVCLKEFYTFYEVQNLGWTRITEKEEDILWFEQLLPKFRYPFNKIYRLVKWEWFNSIIHMVVLVNTLFLITCVILIPRSNSHERIVHLHIALDVASAFLLLYIVENILKIVALGPIKYFKKFWNIFDFFLLSLSLLGLCLEWKFYLLATLRPIKLIRLVRLKKRYRDIMNTLIILIPQLISVGILLLVIYYFFAIIGMEFLEHKVYPGCCVNASYNVSVYFTASLNETSVNVYYLNNFDNLLRSYVTLFNLMVVNNWFIIMEGFASEVKYGWLARIYFMAFFIVTLVVLQLVITYIVEAFKLQLEQSSKPKEERTNEQEAQQMKNSDSRKEQSNKPKINDNKVQRMDDSDSIEDEKRKKKVVITLLPEDIKKLNYHVTFIDETRKKWFSFDHLIRRWRRTSPEKLPEDHNLKYRGRRLRTKDDIHLWEFRSDVETWMEEQDKAFEQVKSSSVSERPPLKERAQSLAKKVLRYIFE